MDIVPEPHPLEQIDAVCDQNNDDDDTRTTFIPRSVEPIIVRGVGRITVFAFNNKFDEEYPQTLVYKVSREEYQETIKRINSVLKENVPVNFRWFLCGCLCCCCTIGFSFCPALFLHNRLKSAVIKVLDWENEHLYHKIGLHWYLASKKCPNSNAHEYVLTIEFCSPVSLYDPD